MIRAWHFVGATLRDGRPVPPDGVWLVHEGPVVLCKSGLHASRHPFDALAYAPGPVICRVELLDGVEAREKDKFVGRRRRIVARRDVTAMLRRFARQCATDVLPLWEAPDVVRQYLHTGDESIRAVAWAAAVESDAGAAGTAAVAAAARAAAPLTATVYAAAGAARAARAAAAGARAAAMAAAETTQRRRFSAWVAKEFATTKARGYLT